MPRKPKRDLYEILGVNENASADEIKQARRRKAAQSHPDLGGDHDEMAAVNHAYDVLMNPDRRRLYDATGNEQTAKPMEEEVRNVILMALQEALGSDSPQILKRAIRLVEANLTKAQLQGREMADKRDKLRAKQGLITVKEGDNLFSMLLDQQMQQLEAVVASCQHGEQVCRQALEQLKLYESAEADIPVRDQIKQMYGFASPDFNPFRHPF